MTKSELLDLAARRPSLPRAALEFARQNLTDSDIEKRFVKLQTAEKRFDISCKVGGWAMFVMLAIGVSLWAYPQLDWLTSASLGIVASACVTGLIVAVALTLRHVAGWTPTSQLLEAVAGTDYCEEGLELLQRGGPLTAAWRDLALKERSQLHVFDLEIMGALGRIHEVRTKKAERRAKLDEACRELHGVPRKA